jgi:hypothetical protein
MVDALPTPRSLADLVTNLNNTTLQTPYHTHQYLSPFASTNPSPLVTPTQENPNNINNDNTNTNSETSYFSPALTLAARSGNLATTRSLLDAGANPYPSPDLPAEHSPLFEAARHGHVRVTQMLLAERLRRGLWGTDRHLRDGRLLREAEERGDVEMVMLLSMEPEDVLSAEDLARTREGRGRSDSVIAPWLEEGGLVCWTDFLSFSSFLFFCMGWMRGRKKWFGSSSSFLFVFSRWLDDGFAVVSSPPFLSDRTTPTEKHYHHASNAPETPLHPNETLPSPEISQNALIRLHQPRENPRKLDQLISWDNYNVSLRLLRHSEIARPHNTTLPPPTSTGTSILQGSASSDVPTVDDDVYYAAGWEARGNDIAWWCAYHLAWKLLEEGDGVWRRDVGSVGWEGDGFGAIFGSDLSFWWLKESWAESVWQELADVWEAHSVDERNVWD